MRTSAVSVAAALLLAMAVAPGAGAQPEPRSFTVAAAGDILVLRSMADTAAWNAGGDGYDFTPMVEAIEPWIGEADLAICHIETPLSADNTGLVYEAPGVVFPLFNGPGAIAEAVAAAGFDTCSTASNHSWDEGWDGLQETLEVLDRVGVDHAGTARTPEERLPNLYVLNGVTVAHIAYSIQVNPPLMQEPEWTVNVIDPDAILADARWAREHGAEFVVASLHWGEGYQVEPTDDQYTLAETLLASPDIDVLVGHHTHAVQPIDWINDKLVVYGMGDFLTDIRKPTGGGDGVIVHLTVTEQPDGHFAVSTVEFTPIWVEPVHKTVLPIDYTLAHGPTGLRTQLESSRERVMDNLTLFENAVTTPADWPALYCNGLLATIAGTSAPDLLVGTAGDDVIVGRGGGDTIWGHGGNDTICGGGGDDHIAGGTGNDFLQGGPGNDTLHGDTGSDAAWGNSGDDVLEGGAGDDFLYGETGNDLLYGGSDDDTLEGGEGTNVLYGHGGSDSLISISPRDVLFEDG
jgi:poly-gamma-glutamate capsule biosynthesis protein CapA/YwtB (metallophosphatase superfamily)